MDELFGKSDLVRVTVMARLETYYVVPRDKLNNIKTQSLFVDIFMFFAAIFGSAFVATLITMASLPNSQADSLKVLSTYKWVFLVAAILCLSIAIGFFISRIRTLGDIEKNSATLGSEESN